MDISQEALGRPKPGTAIRDITLGAGDELVLFVSADTELFCCRGEVAVGMSAVAAPLPSRVLGVGQGLRCSEGTLLTLRARGACRFRLVAAAQQAQPTPPTKQNSLQQWRRRLSWGSA